MTPVQMLSLMASIKECIFEYRIVIKSNVIDATIKEIGFGVNLCIIPSKYELEVESSSNNLQWDAINSLTGNTIQSEEIFEDKNWPSQHVLML